MKKIAIILSAILFTQFCFATSIITGTWDRKVAANKVTLFAVSNGALSELSTSTLNDKKEFAFVLNNTKPGFFVIGTSPVNPANNYIFYFKPGDNLNVFVNDSSYVLVGENTPENKEMQRWHDLMYPIESKSLYFMKNESSYVDFFPLLEEKLPIIQSYKPDYKANKEFDKAFANYRYFDLLNNALYFLATPRSAHPKGEDFIDFYKNDINLPSITATADILDYPYGMTILNLSRMQILFMSNLPSNEISKAYDTYVALDRDLPNIVNSTVKGEVVLQDAKSIKSYEGLLDFQSKYGKYLVTDLQKSKFKDILIAKADNTKGQEAFDFKFKNVDNKEFALSDFKGKLVYVDVWATWCGPCKKEIPSLKKLEAEYANKDIVFLGVSIDEQKSYDKWKEFLISENLPGIQLFAGAQKEEITKPYKINGIPRFMLFDKDGKIITTEAPRPSSGEIKILLDAKLK